MASISCPTMLHPLPLAASQATIDACSDVHDTADTKRILLYIASHLIDLDIHSRLWKTSSPSPYNVSLATLYRRLDTGKLPPSPQKKQSGSPRKLRIEILNSPRKTSNTRSLENFEDLYYALLAKVQDIWHVLSVRINNGFATLEDAATTGLSLTPITPEFDGHSKASILTIEEVAQMIEHYWTVLNQVSIVKALDAAIRRARVRTLNIRNVSPLSPSLTKPFDPFKLPKDLHDPATYEEVPGLAWIGGWAPSMITAWLEEKYRGVLHAEREEDEREEESVRRWEEKISSPLRSPGWEERKEKMELDSVREYGRALRRSVDALGLGGEFGLGGNETWGVYGRME